MRGKVKKEGKKQNNNGKKERCRDKKGEERTGLKKRKS